LAVAIHFGTKNSGYAYSFRHDFEDDPLKVSTYNWISGTGSLATLKTPTTILLDKHKKFHSFGYEAEELYSQLVEDDEHTDWYYFRRFKMLLLEQVVRFYHIFYILYSNFINVRIRIKACCLIDADCCKYLHAFMPPLC